MSELTLEERVALLEERLRLSEDQIIELGILGLEQVQLSAKSFKEVEKVFQDIQAKLDILDAWCKEAAKVIVHVFQSTIQRINQE